MSVAPERLFTTVFTRIFAKKKMELREYRPGAHLSPFIEAYWEARAGSARQAMDKIVPDGCVDVIYNAGDDLYIDSLGITLKSEAVYLGGAITQCMEARMPAHAHLIGARFRPAAFSCFYSFASLHEVTDTFVELEKSFIPPVGSLLAQTVASFDRFFAARCAPPGHALLPVVNDIVALKGNVSVKELTAAHYITERQLERHFRYHTGLTPKLFINIIRYQSASRLILEEHPARSLSDIALESGYYDQAHLSREIKKYGGVAPTALR